MMITYLFVVCESSGLQFLIRCHPFLFLLSGAAEPVIGGTQHWSFGGQRQFPDSLNRDPDKTRLYLGVVNASGADSGTD